MEIDWISKLDGIAPSVADPQDTHSTTKTDTHSLLWHTSHQCQPCQSGVPLCIHANSVRLCKFCASMQNPLRLHANSVHPYKLCAAMQILLTPTEKVILSKKKLKIDHYYWLNKKKIEGVAPLITDPPPISSSTLSSIMQNKDKI